MLRPAAALVLLLAGAAAAEETIWLRGRGSDVWIERDGEIREPRDDRKGVTFVSTPAPPAADCADARGPRGGWGGGPLLGPVGAYASDAAYGVGPDAPYLYGLGYMPYPHFGWYDDRGRHRYRDGHSGRHRDHHRGRHPVANVQRPRHGFGLGFFGGRSQERLFGGHRGGGHGHRGDHRRDRH
jgi:hypothetical protein